MSVSASAPSVEQSSAGQTRRWIDRAGRLWCWLGDGLNPILVKEARQAMKSRFFGAMFAILLALSWGASIFTLALIGPDARFGNQGPVLFSVYHGILCFWLLVVIPFSAYRSLAVEQEDRTYELVSITTLNPRQIVRGKLGSVLVQMVVYLSALAPCLAFTYLLRGIDLVTIFFLLGHTVLASIGLAMLGLLWSTLTSSRHWQVIFTVVLIIGLLAVFFPALSLEVALMAELGGVIPFDEPQFWAIDAAIVSILGGYALLAYFAAAARITFPGDNRSTRLRVMMLAEQLVLLFWMIWAFLSPFRSFRFALVCHGGVDDRRIAGPFAPGEALSAPESPRPGVLDVVQSGAGYGPGLCPGQHGGGGHSGDDSGDDGLCLASRVRLMAGF